MDANMLSAGIIMVAAYILIFRETINRTSAAFIGAVVMVAVGSGQGFYSQVQALQAIDGNTLVLLFGMMVIVAMARPTGGFEYLAIRIAKKTAHRPRLLMIYLGLAVSLLSTLLDNVTIMLVFAPLTLLITRTVKLNPAPYLIAEAILSNIGGAATLVGDPPNVMIGSAAGIDFMTFLIHMAPIVVPVWLLTIGLLLLLFNRSFRHEPEFKPHLDLDETRAIRDRPALIRILATLGGVLLLFLIHHHLHYYPAFVASIGAAVAIALLRPDMERLLREIEWSVLLFFASLFVLVGGVEASGLLQLIASTVAETATDPGNLLIAALCVMWVAALASAIVDNIPFTVTMIPVISGLNLELGTVEPLWWALAIGVGLGGNATHVGASPNIIAVMESNRSGVPGPGISPLMWLRAGVPVTIASLLLASLLLALFFRWYSG